MIEAPKEIIKTLRFFAWVVCAVVMILLVVWIAD